MKKKNEKLNVEKAREIVGSLILQVLTEKLCSREALKLFPQNVGDLSIECAWHALIHYEADEELAKDIEFKEEQDNYLETIAFVLNQGSPLPANMINEYRKYYDIALIPESNDFIGWIKSLIRFTI